MNAFVAMSENPRIQQIIEKYKPIWALNHAFALLGWDLETYMPTGASEPRGFAQAQLTMLKQERVIALSGLISEAQKDTNLSENDKGVLRIVGREVDYYTKVPSTLIEQLQRTATEANVVWREARRKSEFSKFQPYLEKLVELKRLETEKLGYHGHPYNALLDKFEEGLTVDDVDAIFSRLVPRLKQILTKVTAEKRYPAHHPLESQKYEEAAMKKVNMDLLTLLGMPKENFRLDISTHPFTSSMAVNDVRITTRYEGVDFKEAISHVIHESGHAIYELQIDPTLEYTPLVNAPSLGLHESQSRFWENFVGRSKEFTKLIHPILRKNLPFVSGYEDDEIYRYFNMIRPSLIRVEADEITYNFHIVLRYELEKRLIAGDVSASEIPAVWSNMMEEYVGIKPGTDAEGSLQDIHWSSGDFGYFPTYSLGNVIAGMIFNRIRKDMNLEENIKNGRLIEIRKWLREHIHGWGGIYSPKELQQRIFGEVYNPDRLIAYLESKFLT
jgi:carboxypeptidase Taq